MSGTKHTEETKKRISQTLKGRMPKNIVAGWNKGIPLSDERKAHLSKVLKSKGIKPKVRFTAVGEEHPLWKGNDVSYSGLHYWVYRTLGRPKMCEHCGESHKRLTWANKSHEYRRDKEDWLRLCYSCHKKYDLARFR